MTMDDETLSIFVEESREHLETIEGDLLEIEQQGDNLDEELINKVFRAAHSIKGGAGFLGLTAIKELAHKIENILHLVRNFKLAPSHELVDVVLAAYDRLGELLENTTGSNEMDIDDHISALEALVSGTLPNDQKSSVHKELKITHPKVPHVFNVKDYDVKQAVEGGKTLYILKFDLIKDIHRQDKTPLDVVNLLQDSGVVLEVEVDVNSVGDLESNSIESNLPMYILLATVIEPDLIGTVIGIPNEQAFVVSKTFFTEEKAEPAPDVAPSPPESPVVEESAIKEVVVPVVEIVEPGVEVVEPVVEEPVESEPAKVPEKAKAPVAAKPQAPVMETLRVNVNVLDQLMNRAGELVLSRNQLLQSVATGEQQNLKTAVQRIDLVTSELQEAIMMTRMQPVGNIFNKFPRVVRDMAKELDKKIDLEVEGKDVELDKTIIEGLNDPLTHLVRNAADHGIESPGDRAAKGKPELGRMLLKAYYESGQVIIEIQDDGKGLNPDHIAEKAVSKGLFSEEQIQVMSDKEKNNLIMLPGFSTAEQVTDLSGRGVGMDVVKTNLDKMGGQVELLSEIDRGSTIRIKLPLTLAIIPSLLVSSCDERFALPQVNVSELIRIPAAEIREKIEKVGEADVLILRGELIPVLQLNNVLDLKQTFYNPRTGEFEEDRRASFIDRRLFDEDGNESEVSNNGDVVVVEQPVELAVEVISERRTGRENDAVIVVLHEGSHKYGLVVDAVHDTVEIVVKPMGRHLKNCGVYSGATIMGDGHVALILDVPGLALKGGLSDLGDIDRSNRVEQEKDELPEGATRQTLLLFHNAPDEICAIPLHQVLRVEQIEATDIELRGGKKIIQYRGGSLPVYALEEVANVGMLESSDQLVVIIFVVAGNEVGLLAIQPLDVIEMDLVLDEVTLKQPGIGGSTIINEKTTLMVDIICFMEIINPHWFEQNEVKSAPLVVKSPGETTGGQNVLLVEDSDFFRAQVKRFITEVGYSVVEAEDGQKAWEYLDTNPETIHLVVTDLEMPNMDGFELTRKIKSDDRVSHLKVIALTSLAAQEDIDRGKEVGIDEYQIKLEKEKLLESINRHFG